MNIFLKEEKGVALVTVLFFLIIITILAAGTIIVSTTQVTVAGSIIRRDMSFNAAEGGIDFVIPLIKSVYYDGVVPASYASYVKDNVDNFISELQASTDVFSLDTHYRLPDTDAYPGPDETTTPESGPDVVLNINGNQVEVDIDYIGVMNPSAGIYTTDIFSVGYYSQGHAARRGYMAGFVVDSRSTTPKTKSEVIQVIGIPVN